MRCVDARRKENVPIFPRVRWFALNVLLTILLDVATPNWPSSSRGGDDGESLGSRLRWW